MLPILCPKNSLLDLTLRYNPFNDQEQTELTKQKKLCETQQTNKKAEKNIFFI